MGSVNRTGFVEVDAAVSMELKCTVLPPREFPSKYLFQRTVYLYTQRTHTRIFNAALFETAEL